TTAGAKSFSKAARSGCWGTRRGRQRRPRCGAAGRESAAQAGAGRGGAGESAAEKKRNGLRPGGRYVRLTAGEKAEVIRLVEGSDLAELGVHRATFYAWYRCYAEDGVGGLVAKKPAAQRYWNRIPAGAPGRRRRGARRSRAVAAGAHLAAHRSD